MSWGRNELSISPKNSRRPTCLELREQIGKVFREVGDQVDKSFEEFCYNQEQREIELPPGKPMSIMEGVSVLVFTLF